ncbi:MAG: carboxypeptidase regulatory-like domain-containing protein, partial [Eggerthellaceae bacterium]|nr:carboxypeptidase regulatory-like domain-containing protein [Eggerthellaceae bacterium]
MVRTEKATLRQRMLLIVTVLLLLALSAGAALAPSAFADDEGTDPTDLWSGTGWIGQNAIYCQIDRVQAAGVSVESVTWADNTTCDVVLVPSTKKESSFTLNITRSGSSGGIKINGTNNTKTGKVTIEQPMELNNGQATITLQPYWSSRIGTLKTFNFTINGGGQETLWDIALPNGTGYTVSAVDGSDSPVAHKGSYTFQVNFEEGYKKGADFAVKVNGEVVELDANNQSTISSITNDKTVTVEDVVTSDTVNQYNVTLPEVAGATVAAVGGSSSPVDEGGSFSFRIDLDEDTMTTDNFAVKANGVGLSADGEGVYTIPNVQAHQTVTIDGVVQLATITAPANSTISVGYQTGYFNKTWIDPARTTTLADGRVKNSYNAVSNAQLFYRVQNPEGVTYYKFVASLAAGNAIEVTSDQLFIGDSSFTKRTTRDKSGNIADVYMPINAADYVNVAQGSESTLNFFRNWLPIDSTVSNDKEGIPDFHYEVVDIAGNPSDLLTFEPSTYNSGVVTMKAAEGQTGMAVVKVTYDAMYIDGRTLYGPQFGAIWPERTGVFVVTVGQDGTGIQTNMKISQLDGNERAIDAEHDTLYYLGDEGASYRFTPEAGTTVTIARPTVGETLTYSGFSADGVAVDAGTGEVTLSGLVTGRNIVRIEKDGVATYQVLTAKRVVRTLKNEAGETISEDTILLPGDKVTVAYADLVSPSEKFSGKYNFNFRIGQKAEDGTTFSEASPGGYGVYNFTTKDHTYTVTVPAGWVGHTYTLSDGSILKGGFAGGDGTHRTSSYGAGGGMAWGSEGTGASAYSALPELVLNVDSRPYVIEGIANPITASIDAGAAFELDLSTIFADADGDALTYKVAIDGAEPVDAAKAYSFAPDKAGVYNLVFTASDGILESTDTYTVQLKVGQANAAPIRKAGVKATKSASIGTDGTFELDLASIFEDPDNDYLTYKVSVNGADYAAASQSYTYTPEGAGTVALVFKANDGTADSDDTYTVNLEVVQTVPGHYWDNSVDGNGWVGRSATYCYVKTVSSSGVGVKEFEWADATTCNIMLIAGTAKDASFDFAVTNYARSATTAGVLINGTNSVGSSRTVPVALSNGSATVTVQPWGTNTNNKGTLKTFNFTIEEAPNTAPHLADGVEAAAAASVVAGEAYALDLSTIFADDEDDDLTYSVSIDGADPVAANASYSYTPTTAGEVKLVFKANDGTADSADAYAVTLTVTEAGPKVFSGLKVIDSQCRVWPVYETLVYDDITEHQGNDIAPVFTVVLPAADDLTVVEVGDYPKNTGNVEILDDSGDTIDAAGDGKIAIAKSDIAGREKTAQECFDMQGRDPVEYNVDPNATVVWLVMDGTPFEELMQQGFESYNLFVQYDENVAVPTEIEHDKLTHVAAKDPTCEEAGNVEHWKCERCGELFADAEGTRVIENSDDVVRPATGHQLEKVDAVPATCEEDGTIEHWKCSVCGTLFNDSEAATEITEADIVDPGTGHAWGEPTYEWTKSSYGDYYRVKATAVCEHDGSHTTTKTVSSTKTVDAEATADEDGQVTYTATFADAPFTTQTKVEVVPAYGEETVTVSLMGQDKDNSLARVDGKLAVFEGVQVNSQLATSYGYKKPADMMGKATALDALVALHKELYGEAFEANPTDYLATNSSGTTMTKLFGIASEYFMFHVNDLYPCYADQPGTGSVVNDTPLANGDTVRFFDVATDFYGFDVSYLTFDKPAFGEGSGYAAHEGGSVAVTVEYDAAMAGMSGMPPAAWKPAEDAVVAVKDADHETVATATAGEDGVATLSNLPSGDYYLVASEFMEPSYDGEGFSTPYATLTVSAHEWDEGEVTTDPTCSAEGVQTFHCTVDGCGQTKTEPVAIDPDAHAWGEPAYIWADDGSSCTAERICAHDAEHKDTVAATVTSEVTKPATCTEKGETTYTATFEGDAFEAQTKVVADVPLAAHELQHAEAVAATCAAEGISEHWKCSECGKLFSDEASAVEVSASDVVVPVDPDAHSWGEPAYTWDFEAATVTAERTCAHDATHVESETVKALSEVTREPAVGAEGELTWTSDPFENPAFEDLTPGAPIEALT